MMNNDMNANVIAARTALTPIVWGTTYAVTTTWLPAGHPVTAGLLRALPAGLILLLITRTLPTSSWWWRSAVLGILNIGLFFTLLFMAAQQLPGGVAAILTSTSPLVAMAISPFLLGIKPTRGHIVAAILALHGVSAITLTPGARLTVVGVIAGLGSAISMGFGMVLAKRWGQPAGRNPLDTTAWQLIAGGAVLIPFAIAEGPLTNVDLSAVGGYAYLCIFGAALAYSNWFTGLKRLDATAVLLLGALSPVTALLLDAVTHTAPTPLQLCGIIVVLAAIVITQKSPMRASADASDAKCACASPCMASDSLGHAGPCNRLPHSSHFQPVRKMT